MSRLLSRLLRNRFTLFVLPTVLVFVTLMLFIIQIPDLDIGTLSNWMFIGILLYFCGLVVWRRKFPLSFWSFFIFIEPHNARFYNNRAAAYIQRGDYERALEDYNVGLQLQPKKKILAFLRNGRLALFSRMGRCAEALQEAELALQLPSTKIASAAILLNRGSTYQQLFAYDAALQDYEKVIRTNSLLLAYTHLFRGLIYAARGYYQLALQEEDLGVQKQPRSPMSYNTRATVHLKFRQYQRALEDTNQALKRCRPAIRLLTRRSGDYPYAANVYAQRALAYCGLSNYQAALEDARKAVGLAPIYGPHFYSLGQVYLATNDIAQAHQTFQQGFAADPRDVSNAALQAWTNMCMTPSYVEQAPFLNQAAQNYPESEWGHICLGMAAWLCEDYANAQKYLLHAQQLDVTNAHCYFWLSLVHASLEQDDLAWSALQQAVQSGLPRALLFPQPTNRAFSSTFRQRYASIS